MQPEMQFLPQSWKNVKVSCVDRPWLVFVFVFYLFCIIVPPVNLREQDVRTVHYFVSSKNNDSYNFQHLPSVRMPPRLAPSFDHNMTAPNFKSSSI